MLAGLAGLLGSGGPFARRSLALEGGAVDLPRVMRWATADDLVVRFAAPAPEHRLRIAGPLPDRLALEGATPAPARALAGPDWVEAVFATPAEAGAAAGLRLRAGRPGLLRLELALDGGAPARATVLVLP
jgi:hypothetical protein